MYECDHETPGNCTICGAPEKEKPETLTYAEAEKEFKIPGQTIRAAVRNHNLTVIPASGIRIVKNEIQALKNDRKIGRGPEAKRLKRKRS